MCEKKDTVSYLKEQIALATKNEYKASQIRILLPAGKAASGTPTILNDEDTMEKYDTIKSDGELHVVFQISEGEWESVHIIDTEAALKE